MTDSIFEGRVERVSVFCGSSVGVRTDYADAARRLGAMFAGAGIAVVYGGTHVGLMGALADAVLDAGGEAIGVIPEQLHGKGIAHGRLSALEVVADMHARKARMAELADGFVALPGGFGTWEELCEALTWTQLGLHAKPAVVLDVAGFWTGFVEFVAHAADEGFVKPVHRDLLRVARTPDEVLVTLRTPLPPPAPKWQ